MSIVIVTSLSASPALRRRTSSAAGGWRWLPCDRKRWKTDPASSSSRQIARGRHCRDPSKTATETAVNPVATKRAAIWRLSGRSQKCVLEAVTTGREYHSARRQSIAMNSYPSFAAPRAKGPAIYPVAAPTATNVPSISLRTISPSPITDIYIAPLMVGVMQLALLSARTPRRRACRGMAAFCDALFRSSSLKFAGVSPATAGSPSGPRRP